jgi:diguanylate cyclase (GGDEF)-like protein
MVRQGRGGIVSRGGSGPEGTRSTGVHSGAELAAEADTEWVALRRRIGIWTCGLGAAAAVAVCALEWQKGAPDLFEVYGLPAIAAWLFVLGMIYRGRNAAFAEGGLLVAGGGVLLGLVYSNLRTPLPGLESILNTYEAMAWFPALYLFAFALFTKGRALALSVGVLAASLVLSHVGPIPAPASARLGFVEIYIANLGCIGFIFILSTLKERYAETRDLAAALRRSADTDYLTGIPNRRFVEQQLDGELARSAARGQPISLVMLDVDRFKYINDEFGHDSGDRVLQRVARVLEVSVRARDLLARWGGEEFVIALPGIGLEDAVAVSERIRLVLEAQRGGRGPSATASFGVTAAVVGDDVVSLVRRADEAMRLAKREGRNRVVSQAA